MDRKKKIEHEMSKFVTLVLLLILITATTIVFNGNITGNVVGSSSGITYIIPSIQEVSSIDELSSLNEGFYLIKEGYVFYLESADSYIPLYIKVTDLKQRDGIFSVDEDGNIEFEDSFGEK